MAKPSANVDQRPLREQLAELPADLIARAVEDALSAETYDRAGQRRPDHRTQLDAAKLILSYVVGRPAEMPLPPPSEPEKDPDDYEERLANSPAMQGALQRMLERARAKGAAATARRSNEDLAAGIDQAAAT